MPCVASSAHYIVCYATPNCSDRPTDIGVESSRQLSSTTIDSRYLNCCNCSLLAAVSAPARTPTTQFSCNDTDLCTLHLSSNEMRTRSCPMPSIHFDSADLASATDGNRSHAANPSDELHHSHHSPDVFCGTKEWISVNTCVQIVNGCGISRME